MIYEMMLNEDHKRSFPFSNSMETGKDHLCFFYLKISVSSNKLMTIVYRKPPDSHLYHVLTNTESLLKDDIEDLQKKEQFWCGTLVTQHKGLNGLDDWNRVKRTEKPKEWYF